MRFVTRTEACLLVSAALWVIAGPVAAAPPPEPRGTRALGISLTVPESFDIPGAVETAVGAGMQVTDFSIAWDEVETERGLYNPRPIEVARDIYSRYPIALTLTLNIIDTNNLRVPGYLAGVTFDNKKFVRRFKKYLRYVARELGAAHPQVVALAIGNEVDGYLATPEDWNAYRRFFEEVRPLAKRLFPQALLGVTSQFSGLIGSTGGNANADLQALNALGDAVFVTYYPLDASFQVRPPGVVKSDFDALVVTYPDQLILVTECGYPSGAGNGSSRSKQKRFIKKVFQAWDRHPEQIGLVAFTWLHDIPPEVVAFFLDYYDLEDPGFASFLSTLGLRTGEGSGRDKPAFRTLKREAQRRGW